MSNTDENNYWRKIDTTTIQLNLASIFHLLLNKTSQATSNVCIFQFATDLRIESKLKLHKTWDDALMYGSCPHPVNIPLTAVYGVALNR